MRKQAARICLILSVALPCQRGASSLPLCRHVPFSSRPPADNPEAAKELERILNLHPASSLQS